MQRSTLLGDKEDVGQTLVAQSRAEIGIVAQVIGRTRMQRHEP
jgi:rRNA processing protein Gar1